MLAELARRPAESPTLRGNPLLKAARSFVLAASLCLGRTLVDLSVFELLVEVFVLALVLVELLLRLFFLR